MKSLTVAHPESLWTAQSGHFLLPHLFFSPSPLGETSCIEGFIQFKLNKGNQKWQYWTNILETSVGAPLIFPVGKISHGFAKGDWNGLLSVELQVCMTSVEGHIHLSTYKHAGYWHVANMPFLGSRWISCLLGLHLFVLLSSITIITLTFTKSL